MKSFWQVMAIGAAGFIGAVMRFGVARLFGQWFSGRFPAGTLVINVSGSFFLGWFLTFVSFRYPVSDTVKLAVATGFVGAYTTFSTMMFESSTLGEEKAYLEVAAYLGLSLLLGWIAVRAGVGLAHRA